MTNLDASFDLPASSGPALPRRPGIWRVISMIAVIGALVLSALSILQSRSSSDVALPKQATVLLEDVTVTVSDLPIPNGAEISVLGLADSESRRPFEATGTTIDVPMNGPALIGLYDEDRALVGLAIAEAGEAGRDVTISVQSTASALLFMSPGILRPDFDATRANVTVIEADPAFDKLTEAIAGNPVLSVSNPAVEQALAEVADRTPVGRREPDQGCDSVFANNAYPSAGTCVQPKDTGLVITNEQDRWALVYSDTPGFIELCAAVSPTNTEGSEVLIPSDQCQGESLLVAPGPVVNQGDDQQAIDERIRTASAVNNLYFYAGPFAELAGASSGFTGGALQHIAANADEIAGSLGLLVEADEEFADAMDVSTKASTALERHNAALVAARAIIRTAETTTLIPQRVAGDDGYLDLIEIYERSAERMMSARTDWRWESDAIGMADFGAGS